MCCPSPLLSFHALLFGGILPSSQKQSPPHDDVWLLSPRRSPSLLASALFQRLHARVYKRFHYPANSFASLPLILHWSGRPLRSDRLRSPFNRRWHHRRYAHTAGVGGGRCSLDSPHCGCRLRAWHLDTGIPFGKRVDATTNQHVRCVETRSAPLPLERTPRGSVELYNDDAMRGRPPFARAGRYAMLPPTGNRREWGGRPPVCGLHGTVQPWCGGRGLPTHAHPNSFPPPPRDPRWTTLSSPSDSGIQDTCSYTTTTPWPASWPARPWPTVRTPTDSHLLFQYGKQSAHTPTVQPTRTASKWYSRGLRHTVVRRGTVGYRGRRQHRRGLATPVSPHIPHAIVGYVSRSPPVRPGVLSPLTSTPLPADGAGAPASAKEASPADG